MSDNLNGKDDVQVGFGASIEGLTRGMTEAIASVKNATGAMQGHMDTLTKSVGSVTKAFGAVAGIVAGGKLFKDAINETIKFTGEVGGLARTMDLTAREASGLRVAIDDAFLSIDDFRSAQQVLNRQLKTNEEALKSMGIKTRDASGAYLDQKTVLFNALNALREYKAGTDQNIAATVAFGRAMDEGTLGKLMKVQDTYKDATASAEKYNEVVGVENIKAAKEFKNAQNEVGNAMQGVKNAVGNALIPVFTQLMTIFADAIAEILPVLKVAFQVLGVVLIALKSIFYDLSQVGIAFTKTFVVAALAVKDMWIAFQNLDWAGAKNAWKVGAETITEVWHEAGENMIADAKKTATAMNNIIGGPEASADEKVKRKEGTSGNKSFKVFDKNAAKNELELLKAHFEELKRSQGDYADVSKQQEVAYWAQYLTKFKAGTKEAIGVHIEYLKARREAAKESVEIMKFNLDIEVANARTNEAEKVRLADRWLAQMTVLYGADSKEYREALRGKLDAERAYKDQQRNFQDQDAQMRIDTKQAELDLAKEVLQLRVENGEMEKTEALRLERELIREKYELLLADNARRRALWADDVQKQQELKNERLKIEAAMNKDLGELGLEQQRAVRETWSKMFDGLFSSMETVLNGLLNRTMTWKQAMQSIVQSLQQSFVKMAVEKVKNWVLSEETMTAASKVFAAIRTALQGASSAATVATKSVEADAVITENAGEAASGAAASQASIPIAGPYLAAAAAAAMLAMVLAFKGGGGQKIPSAANGWWQVPNDTMAMIHKDEQVLPAPLAEGVRNMIEGGGGFGGGAPNLIVQAMDSHDVHRFLTKHADKIVDVLKGKAKQFPKVL